VVFSWVGQAAGTCQHFFPPLPFFFMSVFLSKKTPGSELPRQGELGGVEEDAMENRTIAI
jgi:hypothetical protein